MILKMKFFNEPDYLLLQQLLFARCEFKLVFKNKTLPINIKTLERFDLSATLLSAHLTFKDHAAQFLRDAKPIKIVAENLHIRAFFECDEWARKDFGLLGFFTVRTENKPAPHTAPCRLI